MVKNLNIVEADFCSPEMLDFLECAVRAGCSIVVGGNSHAGRTTLVQYLSASIGKERQVVCIDSDGDLDLVNPGWSTYIYIKSYVWLDGLREKYDKNRTQLFHYLIEPSEKYSSTVIYNENLSLETPSFIAHSPCNSQFIFQAIGFPISGVVDRIQMYAEIYIQSCANFDNDDIWANEYENPFNKIDIIVTLREESHYTNRCWISDISVVDKQQSKKEHKCVLVPLFEKHCVHGGGAFFKMTKNKIPADLAQKLKESGYTQS